jgi:acetyl/propionyl-CoA carboxylase alpha subunit
VDAAFDEGGEVGTAYDPMIAKVVVHAADREAARRKLIDAIDGSAVFGLTTNLGFVRRLVASAPYADGAVDTGWLDSSAADPLLTRPDLPPEVLLIAADVLAATGVDPGSPFGAGDGWRLSGPPAPRMVPVMVDDGVTHWVEATTAVPTALWHRNASGGVSVAWQGEPWSLSVPDPMRGHGGHATAGEAEIVAPMPATVLAIDVAEGDSVTAGQRLGALEAMKMELALTAPHDGVVTHVGATVGEQVKQGALVLTVEAAS